MTVELTEHVRVFAVGDTGRGEAKKGYLLLGSKFTAFRVEQFGCCVTNTAEEEVGIGVIMDGEEKAEYSVAKVGSRLKYARPLNCF